MIELKEAVKTSLDALRGLSLIPESTPVELEEAELDDSDFWTVTFSYPDERIRMPATPAGAEEIGANLRAILGSRRAYKSVTIYAKDGSVRGIKNIHA
jgi:hypothetical protein